MKTTDIIFIKVADNKTKIGHLCDRIKTYFQIGERILVTVSVHEAASYIDDLLWRYPEDSLLPHHIIYTPSNERVAIALTRENLNNATALFSLLPEAYPQFEQFATVYEFYDETHPSKAELSKQRLTAYPTHTFFEPKQ